MMKLGQVVVIMGICTFLLPVNAVADPPKGNGQNGAVVYQQHCLRCHGTKGDGRGPDAKTLSIKPPSFLSPGSRSQTDMSLLSTIVWGTVYSPMHGWWDRLTSQETRDVVAYIRRLAPYRPE